MSKSQNGHVTNCDAIRERLATVRATPIPLMTWKAISEEWYPGVPRGTLCRIYKDPTYEPQRSEIRDKLDLPPLHIAPACPHCGAPPHAHRNCPARRNGHGKPGPHRLAINLDDPVSAAASIRANAGGDYIRQLWQRERRHWFALTGEWVE